MHPLSNGWFAPPLTAEDQENTSERFGALGRRISRAHHLQFLAWRRLREEWTFEAAPIADGQRFFIPEVKRLCASDEIFLDAGAHYGSVTESLPQANQRIVPPDRRRRAGPVQSGPPAKEPALGCRTIGVFTIARLGSRRRGRRAKSTMGWIMRRRFRIPAACESRPVASMRSVLAEIRQASPRRRRARRPERRPANTAVEATHHRRNRLSQRVTAYGERRSG